MKPKSPPRSARAFFDLVAALDHPPDVLLDLGVGHTNSEAWVCRKRFPNCRIIGVEPHVGRYRNVVAKYPGTLLNLAVGSQAGVLHGYLGKPKYPAGHSNFKLAVEAGSEQHYVKHEVPCTCVDALDQEYGPFKNMLIWADIEGSELVMLQGATTALTTGRIVLLNLELLTLVGWCQPSEVRAFLAQYDYREVGHRSKDVFFARV